MIWVIPTLYLNLSNPETNWEWDKIDTENIHFPKSFTSIMKVLKVMPNGLYFKIIEKGMKKIVD